MTRLRFYLRLNPSKSEAGDLSAYGDVTFAPMEALADCLGGLDTTSTKSATELAEGNYNYFAEGDLLLAKVTPCFENGKKAWVNDLPNRIGFATSEVHVVRADYKRVSPRYIRYLFSSEHFRAAGIASMTGAGGLRRISDDAIKNFSLPVLDLEAQEAIAGFLDRETDRIARLIAKKERQAEVIAEREAATFLGAVTGQDRPASKAFSGVEWIGDIPAHWQAPKFTHVARQESGHTPSRTDDTFWVPEECLIPWFSLADVWQIRSGGQVYITNTTEKISQVGMDNSAARLLPADTVVLSRTASVGFPAILGIPMATTQDFVGWVCGKRLRPKFLYYVLRAMKPEFRRLMIGSTHQTIYMPDIRSFRLPLPPLDEQDEIISTLDRVVGRFRAMAAKIAASVEKLKEHRAALITAAVSGQLDVDAQVSAGSVGVARERLRVLVGAEIVHSHQGNARFGRVKLQKLLYLAEAHAGISELGGNYMRQAAGPLDRILIEATERGMETAAFFRAEAAAAEGGIRYKPLAQAGQHRAELSQALDTRVGGLRKIISALRDFDTRNVEAIATLYAVWNDALLDGGTPDENAIISSFLEEWHAEKREKFKDADLHHWLAWMNRNDMVPRGSGPRTISTMPRSLFS